ncbi:hypothetical protein EDD70_1087 [Hydrogenoanaerobacterium saccharovorans]|uniref:Uncharacterized protein n=1 Tax=Hydrogenoanaerobacterium saccharovorans TaxID=474960 RepID=A0A1H7ZYF9_9FIRM|nr:hypothetical protein [Hydrogenoanaerobacterium saccharovorans]RPF48272.1 hypothetical protein EDD70_1087 [Hydrogenoanaerobacterium saccharovorans]SEM63702.1 hypothetical protein SAMN05216180_1004 [Hydrogenoanaerobacterium saccharovorans]
MSVKHREDSIQALKIKNTQEQLQFAELALKLAQQDTIIADLQQANAQLLLQMAQTGGNTNV